jgi:XTP/dITP diphosphohydrolase
MKLLYGTANQSKLQDMKEKLIGLDIELISLNELIIDLPDIDESGNTPLDNAIIKAKAYYRAVGMPVFSCDSGLYIEGIDESKQPGVHVRRVGGKVLNDEEMITYYAGLAAQAGGQAAARYKNAIALVLDENTCYAYDGDDISSVRFLLTSKPHKNRRPGLPLDSISLELDSGKYYMDIASSRSGMDERMGEGFRSFFKRALLDRLVLSK